MRPIPAAFNRLRRAGRKAVIPFIMGGDFGLDLTRRLLPALAQAGADFIEVGIPFSDPLADGPVIQAASSRALRAGATPSKVLRAIAQAAPKVPVPILALTYWNLVLQFGRNGSPEPFLRAARASGLAGIIVPDLPLEAGSAWAHAAARHGLSAVFLAAPTSGAERLRRIARLSDGFIYYVSVTGTTGVRRRLPPQLIHDIRELKLVTTKPVCVGFGISTPGQAATVARAADGVIIGSALIRAITQAPAAGRVRAASKFVAAIRRRV